MVMPSMSTGVFCSGAGGSGSRTCKPGAGSQAVGLPGLHAVKFDTAVFGERRRGAAGQPQQARQPRVNTHARQSLGDGHRAVSH